MFKSNDCLILSRNLILMEYTDKQLQIIEIASELFAEKGFDGTSVRDIAKAADVNIAMISYYFGSKEKLLEAIFTKHSTLVRLQLESLLQDKQKSPFEKMNTLVETYLEKYFSQQCFHKIIARSQMSQQPTAVSAMLIEMKKQNQELIKKLIQEGQKKGDFKKNIDVPMMMATMIGTAHQIMNSQPFYREVNNMQHLSDEEFAKTIRKKLTQHLKTLFKAILTHED